MRRGSSSDFFYKMFASLSDKSGREQQGGAGGITGPPNTEGEFPFVRLRKERGWCCVQRGGLKSDQEGLGPAGALLWAPAQISFLEGCALCLSPRQLAVSTPCLKGIMTTPSRGWDCPELIPGKLSQWLLVLVKL